MAINVYLGGTTGATDGTLEIPHDFDTRVDVGTIGSVSTLHFRASSGKRNGIAFDVPTPANCEVSLDGTTYASSVTYAQHAVTDTNTPLYIKRVSGSIAADITHPTSPRLSTITEVDMNAAPAAFTPTVSGISGTEATVTVATTDPNGDSLTYKVAVTTSPTPPADWSGYSVVTSPHTVTGLTPDATYYAHGRAFDGELATVGTSASFVTESVDVTAPVLAGTLTLTPSPTSIVCDWPDATDNVGVVGYDVEYGTTLSYGSTITDPTTSTATITGLSPETTYYVRVRAYDAAGNFSDYLTDDTATTALPWFTLFGDTFNRADSTTVGNGWTQETIGTYAAGDGIYSNALRASYETGTAPSIHIWRATDAGPNRAIEATYTTLGAEVVLFVARRGSTSVADFNAGFGYRAQITRSNVFIHRIANGATSLAGTVSHTATAGTVYRFEREGNDLTLYANGTAIASATDSTYCTTADVETYGVGVTLSTSTTAGQTDCRIDDLWVEFQNPPTSISDDFNRANSLTVGNNWLQTQLNVGGGPTPTAMTNYGIVSNTLFLQTPAASQSNLAISKAVSLLGDYDVEVTAGDYLTYLYANSSVPNALELTTPFAGNGYVTTFNPVSDSFTIRRMDSGAQTVLFNTPVATAPGDTVTLGRRGTDMVAWVNGTEVARVTDTTHPSHYGYVGITLATLTTLNATNYCDNFAAHEV